jgi:hypothetical protein
MQHIVFYLATSSRSDHKITGFGKEIEKREKKGGENLI